MHSPPSNYSLNNWKEILRGCEATKRNHVHGQDLHNPSFAQVAEAASVLGVTAETPEQVAPMIAQAVQHDGPALVEVPVSRQELSMPPTITVDQAKGFSLFMLRAVLSSGRGDEIVDLARVNVFR